MQSARQSGQALIIILLIMAVGLTVGLSVISRSTSDIKISKQEEEAARAFSVAELGIERALIGGALSDTVDGIDYTVTTSAQGGSDTFSFGDATLAAGEAVTLWLVDHDASGNPDQSDPDNFPRDGRINLCWGNDDSDLAAIEAILIYRDGPAGSFKSARRAYDADWGRGNGFERADSPEGGDCSSLKLLSRGLPGNGRPLDQSQFFDLPVDAIPYLLRLRLLYNSHPQPLAVYSTTNNFPSQGVCYESVATAASGVSRKVRQCQFYAAPPAIFDYALFSGSDLVK